MDKRLELYKNYKEAYYLGNPLISDVEFDAFEAELIKEFPNLRDELIGWEDTSLDKFKHPTPMSSLDKINFYKEPITGEVNEDIINWFNKNLYVKSDFIISPKYDGNAVNVIYKNERLWKVLSRGNGTEGRDYTNKFPNLPKEIKVPDELKNSTIEFRGEALIDINVFNQKYSQFKNPRNFVAGLLNQKEFDKNQTLDLVIEFFTVVADGLIQNENLISYVGLLTKNSLFLKNDYETINGNTWESFVEIYHTMYTERMKNSYFLDGFVISVVGDKRNVPNGKNPADAIAIKFPPEEKITTIENIEINIGKTGEFTPVFNLSPVQLDGTTVSRASGHNFGYIFENKFFPGAKVTISKSGDIIPQLRKVVNHSTVEYIMPIVCPSCQNTLNFDGTHLTCQNPNCDGQNKRKLGALRHLGIMHLGDSMLDNFWDAGFRNIMDFFDRTKMNEVYLSNTGYFKEGRLLNRILNEFKKINTIKLADVIYLLQFENVGKTISKEYAKKLAGVKYSFKSLDKNAIIGINDDLVNNFVKHLETNGYKIENPMNEELNIDTIFIEMTGVVNIDIAKTKNEFLSLFTNVRLAKLKDAHYLITNDKNSVSSKMKQAEKLGKKVLTYSEFYEKFR